MVTAFLLLLKYSGSFVFIYKGREKYYVPILYRRIWPPKSKPHAKAEREPRANAPAKVAPMCLDPSVVIAERAVPHAKCASKFSVVSVSLY